jgi:hypothetical protein
LAFEAKIMVTKPEIMVLTTGTLVFLIKAMVRIAPTMVRKVLSTGFLIAERRFACQKLIFRER